MELPTNKEERLSSGQLYQTKVKRGLDLVFAVLLVICLSPIMLGLAIWIKLDSKGPVLFRQERVGRNGETVHDL